MIHLGLFETTEIIIGIIFWWVGIYLLSRNPRSQLAWVVFALLGSFGFYIGTDPIYSNITDIEQYVKWGRILDFPLFFTPIFYFHASLLLKTTTKKFHKYLLIIGYLGAIFFYTLYFRGDHLIVKNEIIRIPDFKYNYVFAPGILLWPAVIFVNIYIGLAIINFLKEIKRNFIKFFLVILGGIIYIGSNALLGISFYTFIPHAVIFVNISVLIATLLVTYAVVRYHLFAPSEKIIFGKDFLYLTIGMIFLLGFYISIFSISGITLNLRALAFLSILTILILSSHTFYDWFTTFIRDIVYNISSGFSVVNDEEIYQALRNYNSPEKLEDSTLLRLNAVNQKIQKDKVKTPVDSLRMLTKEAVEYFKPEDDGNRRTKQSIKYHMLKMIVFDQSEEGQILWELGFDEYPLRIMTKEAETRTPLFKVIAPSDYTYTSRNAFIALKKEAIHDVSWRISYLEKLSKKKII